MVSETYKPSQHGGTKKDGTEDKRVGTGQFAHGKVDPHQAGQSGGHSSGSGGGESTRAQGNTYKPSEHGGLKENGEPDGRMNTGEFAFGKVDPHEAGAKGGHSSGGGNSGEQEESSGGSGGNSGNSGDSGGSAKSEFAHGKVDPHEAGKKGGKSSGNADDEYEE